MAKIEDYYDGIPEIQKDAGTEDVMKISPSSIAKFFTATSQWYNEEVEGNEKVFQGSTSTHLGTIVHHCAEVSGNEGDTTTFEKDVEDFLATIKDPNVDKNEIRSLWFDMASALVSDTILDGTQIHSTEKFIFKKLVDNVYVGGTYDALIVDPANPAGLIVRDYKTASKKPSGITYEYKLQAYTYAWMLKEAGHPITGIELAFVTRPTKTLPVRTFVFREPYTNDNHMFIGSLLSLISESVAKYKSTPELRYLLAQDYRLKSTGPTTAFPTKK